MPSLPRAEDVSRPRRSKAETTPQRASKRTDTASKGAASKSAAPKSSAPKSSASAKPEGAAPEASSRSERDAPDLSPALMLLGLLQEKGRLIDFLEQDIETFDDAEIGAAVRVVHEGCRSVLRGHAQVEPVRSEEEESRVVVKEGMDTGAVKLTGDLSGEPPYQGVLRHRGWRVARLSLPTPVAGHDPRVVAPAEVEL